MTSRARAALTIASALVLSTAVGAIPEAVAATPDAPVHVAIVVPITVPASANGLLSIDTLSSYTAPFGLLTRELNEVIDRPVTLAIDPMIIVSIRILGTSAPASAVEWLARLEGATNETFPLAWADANLTLGLQARDSAVLAPESFSFAIDPSLFAAAVEEPAPTETPSETATPDPTEPVVPPLPTDESLLAWNYTIPSIAWPAMNTITDDDLATLGKSYDSVLVSSGNLASVNNGVALTTVDGTTAVVSDETLSGLFSTTVGSASGADWQAAMVGLGAAVAAVPQTSSAAASIVLTLDRSVFSSDADLGVTIDGLAANASIIPVGLSEIIASAPTPATLTSKPQDPDRVARVTHLLATEAQVAGFAVIAEDPTLITGERRLHLLAGLSNAWTQNPSGWLLALASYDEASTAILNSVKIVQSSDITLWADRASLPVTVANDLGQPITVNVTVKPLSPLLKIENSLVAVTVAPGSQRKAQIPVQSLSNGVVELEITLHGANGRQIGDLTHVKTTVQAGWETPFTIGVGIFVVLIFAFGIIRTIVRRRRASRTDEV